MHQQARHRGSSPATAPQTNPTRSNNPRDGRTRTASETPQPGPAIDPGGEVAAAAAAPAVGGPTRESIKKLDQIVQNFFLKAAVLIVQARIPVTPSGGGRSRKSNRWFQIETDDIDEFRDELRPWKQGGSFDARRQPLVLETYLDASRLAPGQALVVLDENGKRWDALEALNSTDLSASGSATSSSGRSESNKMRARSTEIVLERWKIELQAVGSPAASAAASTSTVTPTSSGGSGGSASSTTAAATTSPDTIEDFGPILPTIYKRSIVFFRSLFVTTHVLPAYRFSRQASVKNVHSALAVRCRVLSGADVDARIAATGFDSLRQPLYFDGAREPTTDYMFGDLEVPVGRFSASVAYRNDCRFRIDDSESLLSSRFMGIDENYFQPSLPAARPGGIPLSQHTGSAQPSQSRPYRDPFDHRPAYPVQQPPLAAQPTPFGRHDTEIVGSLPARQRHGRTPSDQSYHPAPQQTYGSLSTFHGAGALGTSPMTALKNVRPMGSDTSSPTDSIRPSSAEHDYAPRPEPHSLPMGTGHAPTGGPASQASASVTARPPMRRNVDGRRTSVSFQPFKAGSLSGSPRTTSEDLPVPSSPLSGSRPSSGLVALAQARSRSSLTAGMAASLRGAPVSTSVGSTATVPAGMLIEPGQSPSPRPSSGIGGNSRYSSSFTHRRGRSSFGGASRADDDQGSSGKQSLASSMAQPGSGLLAELAGVGGTSSGSFQTDDDNISDFLKALENKKTLQSFEPSNAGRRGADAAARRTAAQLSRFQLMRESNVALTDSMSLSMQLPARSPVSGVSGLSSVSGVSATLGMSMSPGVSPGMSPGKPQSPHPPHTPHVPAVPSRLSENAIIEYASRGHNGAEVRAVAAAAGPDDRTGRGLARQSADAAATAIDIPLSPRLMHHHAAGRRSSSAAQKKRASADGDDDDDDADLAAFVQQRRSLSVGAGVVGTAPSMATAATAVEPPSLSALFRLDAGNPAIQDAGGAPIGAAAHVSSAAAAAPTSTSPSTSLAAALRSTAATTPASGTSPRRRYMGRHPQQILLQQEHRKETASGGSSVASLGGAVLPAVDNLAATSAAPDRRLLPLTASSSRGPSLAGSYIGRYSGGGGSGSAGVAGSIAGTPADDDEPLVFDLSELGRDPSRRSLEESRGSAGGGGGGSSRHHQRHHRHHRSDWEGW